MQLLLHIVDLERGQDDSLHARSIPILVSVQRIAFLSGQLESIENPSDGMDLLLEVMKLEYPSHFLALKHRRSRRGASW